MNPGTPAVLRGINDRAALDLLLEHGPLSRTRIGELTGLSKPTASQLLTRLTDAGLVVTSGSTTGGPGPRAQLYAVNPDAAHVAGLDVTPGRVHAAVADVTGRTIGEYELPTPRRAHRDAVAEVLEALAGATAAAGLRQRALARVVVGTPGAFDPGTGRLRYARHLPGWHDPDLLDRLGEAVGVPLEVANDVNLAAAAEQDTGAAQGVADFVLLWAEDGIGAAVVIDGRLHRGATGGAGEVGFLPLPGTPKLRDVRRGNAGGFQDLAGGPAVLALGRAHGLRGSTPQVIVARAVAGDHDAFLGVLAERVALGIAALVAVVDPALVVLAGSVLAAGGPRLRDRVGVELGSLAAAQPTLALSAVTGRPVLAGALRTALSTVRDEVFDTVALTRRRTR
ncbi:ROK family transcriptional regulator [Nocardioides mangrovicus]|uniref:ROK family transcriptional regulator n=1 Tax=Nocardioides mangrovicus TaxID=2478913 RepID=A0A3L8NZ17_9ACTN|nr:ROK family transcriptional regulator [Nocardioides mangrovicus]RLV48144.1 ROK family transcriptional regulator [Nocardioides mangrovicus]